MQDSEKKLYRVDWSYVDPDDSDTYQDYAYIGATTAIEATEGIYGTDFIVREASLPEIEAYVAGYEDGHEIATVNELLKEISRQELADLQEFEKIVKNIDIDPDGNNN